MPVDPPRVEVEVLPVGRREGLLKRQEVVDPEGGLALHVAAVQLHIAERPLDQGALLRELRGHARLLASDGQGAEDLLAGEQGAPGSVQLRLDPFAAGVGPARRGDGLVALVVDRVLAEPCVRPVVQVREAERVDGTGRHLHHVRPAVGGRAVRGHRADCGGHVVDGDHVEGSLGSAGKVLQQAAGVGDDDRFGHAEPADPAGERLRHCRFDDGRAHDRQRDGASGLGQRRLGEGLGESVRVGETEGGRPGATHLHQPRPYPALADLLALGAQGGCSGCAEFGVRLAGELLEPFGCAALVLDGVATPSYRGGLGSPVHRHGEVALGEQLLGGEPAAIAGHVGRRDRDQMRGGAKVPQ